MKSISKFSKDKRGSTCLNCEKTISPKDNFCPHCGQINNTNRISLKYYFEEYLSGFFSFDNRFFKTVIPLIFKPGKVTQEFIEGKRKKYVNPFQLYLNISIIFFLLIGVINTINNFNETQKENLTSQNDIDNLSKTLDSINKVAEDEQKEIDSTSTDNNSFSIDFDSESDSLTVKNTVSSKKKDTVMSSTQRVMKKISDFIDYDKSHDDVMIPQALKELGYEVNNWNIFFFSKAQNINKFLKDPEFRSSYTDHLISKISIALFLLLPVFTLIVSLLYLRNKYNYSEHLVFVFHTQTVFFIFLIFFIVFDLIFKTELTSTVSFFLFLFYLYIALKRFYKQGWIKTFVKYFILNSFYFLLALIGGIIVSFIAFLI